MMEYDTSSQPQASQAAPPPTGPHEQSAGISRGLFVAVSVVALCSLLGLVLLGLVSTATILNLSSSNTQMKRKVDSLNNEVEYLRDESTRFWIASDMYTAGVTDSFYSQNVLFCADGVVVMDVSVQGDLEASYTGEGKFTAGDADLKAKIDELMLKFKRCYDNAKNGTMADFSTLEVQISVYGYDLATYKNDTVTLVKAD